MEIGNTGYIGNFCCGTHSRLWRGGTNCHSDAHGDTGRGADSGASADAKTDPDAGAGADGHAGTDANPGTHGGAGAGANAGTGSYRSADGGANGGTNPGAVHRHIAAEHPSPAHYRRDGHA